MITHLIWCRGCNAAWLVQETIAPLHGTTLIVTEPGPCACTCTDPAQPLYEAWVTDPDLAELPETTTHAQIRPSRSTGEQDA